MKLSTCMFNTLILSSVAILSSCSDDISELNNYKPFNYAIVEGDTVKFRADEKLVKGLSARRHVTDRSHAVVGDTVVAYRNPKFSALPAPPDLSALKDNTDPELKGKPLRMVAIGGNVLAGVRDGGYFNEGIATSLPNLIARQMRLAKFEQPQFAASDYNGVGRKEFTNLNPTKGPVPKMKVVMNNTAIESASDKGVRLKPLKNQNGSLDNYSVPFGPSSGHTANSGIPFQNASEESMFRALYRLVATAAVSKKNAKENLSIWDELFTNKADIVLLETGFNDLVAAYAGVGSVKSGSNPVTMFSADYIFSLSLEELGIRSKESFDGWRFNLSDTYMLASEAYRSKVKNVIIINTPDVTKFPYFTYISRKKAIDVVINAKSKFYIPQDAFIRLTSTADSLLSPIVANRLKPGIGEVPYDPLRIYVESSDPSALLLNKEKEVIAKRYNYPVVDFYGIYNRILANNYVTDDGVKVNPAWPGGNFFSTDGLHPTAFGQAVLANEVIKVVNKRYGVAIPLVQTRSYL